ncbi:hypothetical protein BJ944DRAFT_244249 [Cunninghamella echinulata]|nr:hypothetical protein BJ944DRAFT_244249 [Cunninghamella echinulata]
MSFDLDWNKLDDELAGYVIQFLNRNFQAISKPSFIGNINVIAFDWGTTAPTVEIIDITDPFTEFYEPNDTEDDLDNNNNNINNNNNNTRDTLNNNNNNNIGTSSNNSKINTLPTSPTITSHSNDPYFNTVESNHSYRPERFSYPLSPQPLFHQQQQLLQQQQQQQQQQRIQLMHSFHRSPLVAPQHPFNHMVPATPHGTSSYFPSRTTSPTTSSSFIEYRQQQQQQQQQQQNDNSTGIDIHDWIDDELNHSSTASKQFHSNPSPPPPLQPASQPPSIRDESTRMDFQAHLLVSYKGDMSMTILTELRMNYPSMEFMSLPIQLCVRSVEFEATAVVAYIQSMNRVCVSMLEAEEEDISTIRDKDMIGLGSLLRHVHIESIVGDEQKHVLKNVGKIERFIVDQLRRMLDDELVFPSYQCVELG